MGEYVITTMTIGGTAARDVIETGLFEAVAGHFGFTDDGSDLKTEIAEVLADGTAVTFQGECNFGKADDVDAFCRRHGLTYHRAFVGALGVFESGLEYWRPGMDEPVEEDADEEGEPILPLRVLQSLLAGGSTLADVVTSLERASPHAVPALAIGSPNGSEPA